MKYLSKDILFFIDEDTDDVRFYFNNNKNIHIPVNNKRPMPKGWLIGGNLSELDKACSNPRLLPLFDYIVFYTICDNIISHSTISDKKLLHLEKVLTNIHKKSRKCYSVEAHKHEAIRAKYNPVSEELKK